MLAETPGDLSGILEDRFKDTDAGVREWRVTETASIIAAFLVPRPGASVNEEAVLSFVRERLAAYKCPKQIWFVPALPRTANGKLNRKALERP